MPIYAYKCASCGFAKDVLQKMSDAPLRTCPQCSGETFGKQLTAAGFQLKGSGWYVTDFRGGSAPATGAASGTSGADSAAPASAGAPSAEPAASSSSAPTPAAASASAAPAANA